MADDHLRQARRTIAQAVAPDNGGTSFELALYAAGGANGTLDPAFNAHARPFFIWSMAHWYRWVPSPLLDNAMRHAKARVLSQGTARWAKVTGPAAAVAASAARIGWNFINGRTVRTDDGETLDFGLDPPVVITQAVQRAVRRWRLHNISNQLPSLVPQDPDLDIPHDRSGDSSTNRDIVILDFPEAIDSLLQARAAGHCKVFEAWQPKFRGDLRSAITNGQWPQARLASTRKGWVDDNRCQLCFEAVGNLAHRLVCPAIVPASGWQAQPVGGDRLGAATNSTRLELLSTRSLYAMKVQLPARPPCDTFQWMLEPDSQSPGSRWFIDGSLFDEANATGDEQVSVSSWWMSADG